MFYGNELLRFEFCVVGELFFEVKVRCGEYSVVCESRCFGIIVFF